MAIGVLRQYFPNSPALAQIDEKTQPQPQLSPQSNSSSPSTSNNTSDSSSSTNTNSGGCYIATCVYGSYDCPEVWALRRFRDNTLAQNVFGRIFIKAYYSIIPRIVHLWGRNEALRKIWKIPLDKLVSTLKTKGIEDTPYED